MILVLTQSRSDGKNSLIAEDCITLLRHFGDLNPDKRNFDDVSETLLKAKDYDKIVMVVPEWNGSFPYTLKQMIDNSGWPSQLKNTDIYLIGTSGGAGGNRIGISHLTDIFHYIGANVNSTKIYIEDLNNFNKDSDSAKKATELIRDLMKELCSEYLND